MCSRQPSVAATSVPSRCGQPWIAPQASHAARGRVPDARKRNPSTWKRQSNAAQGACRALPGKAQRGIIVLFYNE